MGAIDVAAEIEIAADPSDIASVMFDPHREPEWVSSVRRVEVIDPSVGPGARVVHHGQIAGKELTWQTAIASIHFPHVLVLQVAGGPVVGTVRYDIQRSGGGSRVRIRSQGDVAAAWSFLPSSAMAAPLRALMVADLDRLKALVEQP
jgi:carbon monoxide dehydrogenase subunit G